MDELITIYTSSINILEQNPPSMLKNMLNNTNFYFYVLRDLDKTLGFAIVYSPKDLDFCLLDYMAVDHTYRNQGYGKKIFGYLTKIFHERHMIIEIDSPYQASADQDLRKKRMIFYQRQGSRYIEGIKYILPLTTNGTPPEMLLLLLSGAYKKEIPKNKLILWIKDIYKTVYQCSSEDPRIDLMMSKLPQKIELLEPKNSD